MLQVDPNELLKYRSTNEVLRHLLDLARRHRLGIRSIRYYRIWRIGQSEHLVSVDCAGHDDPLVVTKLRLGEVYKTRSPRDKPREDGSFDIFAQSDPQPIVFQIEEDLGTSIQRIQDVPIPFYHLRDDKCDKTLGRGATRDAWADIPLQMAGRDLGKLSCSLELGRVPRGQRLGTELSSKLLAFQHLAAATTPFLESLLALDVNNPLEEAGRDIFTRRNYKNLYKYCTGKLRALGPFDYEAADILVVSEDSLKYDLIQKDCELLILRATTYKPAEEFVNRKHYFKKIQDRLWLDPAAEGHPATEGGQGLTPWVWRTGRSLRLSYNPSDPNFERALRAYEKDPALLSWKQWIPTTAEPPRSLLIVPILRPKPVSRQESPRRSGEAGQTKVREVLGIIRFVNKKGDGQIEPREEVLLSQIANRCIAPKLLSLKHELTSRLFVKDLKKMNIFRLDSALGDFPKVLEDSVKTFFPHEGKAFLLNLLCEPGREADGRRRRSFRPVRIWSDIAGLETDECELYKHDIELNGTLTDYALASGKEYVFINDMRYAASQRRYLNVNDQIACALASPIQFEGTDYGAFVILSNRFDLIHAMHGPLVHALAVQIGQLLAHRKVIDFANCIKGLHHDGASALLSLYPHLARLREKPGQLTGQEYERYCNILDFWNYVISVHCRTGPPNLADIGQWCRGSELDLDTCISLAAEQAWMAVKSVTASEDYADHLDIQGTAGLKPAVWRASLIVSLFNLLKNAWANHEVATRVSLSAAVEGRDLIIRITNQCTSKIEERIAKVSNALGEGLPNDYQILWQQSRSEGVGLRLVNRLADWHRLPDPEFPRRPRSGSLSYSVAPDDGTAGARFTFILQLPCWGS